MRNATLFYLSILYIMKVLVFITIITSFTVIAYRKDCSQYKHFWRPYNGTTPEDALLGGIDDDGTLSYIARIFVPDKSGKIVPVQIKLNQDHIDFQWCCNSTLTMRVEEHIEILCTTCNQNFSFKPVAIAKEYCCLVEAAVGYYFTRKKIYTLHVGRKYHQGKVYIGQTSVVPKTIPILQFMYGSNSTYFKDDFELLTYNCKQ